MSATAIPIRQHAVADEQAQAFLSASVSSPRFLLGRNEHALALLLSADPRHMASYEVRFAEQYFEDFLCLSGEVFVDAGGFDGDTTELFCERYSDYRAVFLLEPSAKNMQDAKTRRAQRHGISFIEQGISDQAGTLWHDYRSKIHGDVTRFVDDFSGDRAVIHIENTMLAFILNGNFKHLLAQ